MKKQAINDKNKKFAEFIEYRESILKRTSPKLFSWEDNMKIDICDTFMPELIKKNKLFINSQARVSCCCLDFGELHFVGDTEFKIDSKGNVIVEDEDGAEICMAFTDPIRLITDPETNKIVEYPRRRPGRLHMDPTCINDPRITLNYLHEYVRNLIKQEKDVEKWVIKGKF